MGSESNADQDAISAGNAKVKQDTKIYGIVSNPVWLGFALLFFPLFISFFGFSIYLSTYTVRVKQHWEYMYQERTDCILTKDLTPPFELTWFIRAENKIMQL